ncbi:MAG TPA: CAP domain-containing protein [Kofleriaceae bacterium]|nr:CAP domain-containing protein [Kofleriaceae bacterium]
MQTRWPLIAILSAACGSDDPAHDVAVDASTSQPANEPAELAGITAAHNAVRAMVQTQPALAPLAWDASLAATAAAWVAQCKDAEAPAGLIDHNANRSNGHPFYVGENVFGASGSASAQQAVMSWAAEKANYNYATNACSGICGHYTQIVWRATLKVGCAKGTCPGLTYGSTIVCNYGPGGNVNGAKPY